MKKSIESRHTIFGHSRVFMIINIYHDSIAIFRLFFETLVKVVQCQWLYFVIQTANMGLLVK